MSVAQPTWTGTDVSVAQVLGKLKELRLTEARAEIGDGESVHARSSVLDVVIVASDPAEAEQAAATLEAMAVQHPCRGVVVLDQPGAGASRIDATVTWFSRSSPGGVAFVYEQVFLRVSGPAGEHIPSLVDSLLLPDVATYLWWTGSPPLGKQRFAAALEAADVLLFDSARFQRPYETFIGLAGLAAGAPATVFGDLHWMRLQPWREVLAQFFNPGDRRGFLRGIGAVGVDYMAEGRGNRSAAALLAGWLGSALGWRLRRAAAGRGGILVAHLVSPGGRPVELDLRPVEMDGFAPGEIGGVRLEAVFEGHTCRLHALRDEGDNGHVVVEGEIRGSHFPRLLLPVPSRADADLLSRLLAHAHADRVYPRALQLGAEILRSARS